MDFDISFLDTAVFQSVGIHIENFYFDTLSLSQKLLPELARHRLRLALNQQMGKNSYLILVVAAKVGNLLHSSATHLLVQGQSSGTTKEKKALRLIAEGYPIQILSDGQ